MVLMILSWTCICFILIKILWLSLPEKLLFGDICSLLQCAFHQLFQSFSLLNPPPPFLQSTASSHLDLPPSGQKLLNQVPSRGFNRMHTNGRNDLSLLVLHHDFYNPGEGFFLSYMLLQITLRSFEGLWIPVLKTKATIILKSVA